MPVPVSRVGRIAMTIGVAALAVTASLSAAAPAGADPRDGRIVGGTPASTASFPYVVAIADAVSFPDQPSGQYCGGTLVAPTKVVTAAHCVADNPQNQNLRVIGGRDDLRSKNGTVRVVSSIWVHPQWSKKDPKYVEASGDVAVLTLDRELPYRPIRMVTSLESGIYKQGTATRVLGWGATKANDPATSARLRQAQLPISDQQKCEAAYRKVNDSFDPAAYVCGGFEKGGVDTCQGDSGGPLVINGRLAGVTSFGNSCAKPGFPGVYTKLTQYAADVRKQIESS